MSTASSGVAAPERGAVRSLVVGLGRSGAGLHLPALAAAARCDDGLFSAEPVLACDPAVGAVPDGVLAVPSLRHAADRVDARATVAHVCTPPHVRADVLTELAELGFRRVIVEKPLATGVDELERIVRLRERHGLRIAVVTHWLDAELTGRLHGLVRAGTLGALRRIRFRQHKPRFRRSVADRGHGSAFDVEVPHSLAVALRLAGPARVRAAACSSLRAGDATVPWMGGARLVLDHHGGARTEIVSDLTSPVRRRSVTLDFASGRAVGHYPIGESDEYAQLTVTGAASRHDVFPDDALRTFLLRAYRLLRDGDPALDRTFRLHQDVVRLTAAAKEHSGVTP